MNRVLGAVAVVGALAVAGASAGCQASASKPTSARKPTTTTVTTTTVTTAPTTAKPTTTAPPTTAAPATVPKGEPSGCRPGNPLANVYHAYRLHIRNRCMQVAGTVVAVRHEDDGDIHINLRLPANEAHLLDHANYTGEHGDLVTEIVPADEPGCTRGQPPKASHGSYNYGICTGADIGTPPVGSKVTVVGPYVLDADHGWMEIHPVWGFTVVGHVAPATTAVPRPTSAPAPPPPPTTAAPAPSGCHPRTNGGNCYEPGEYCRSSDHGASGVAGDGRSITCVDSNGWRWEPA